MGENNDKNDQETYSLYANHINPSYPDFLCRLGLEHTATLAEGAIITDSKGSQYIDCTAGYGLFNLGHNHPSITQALIDQLQSKLPLTRPLITDIQAHFAQRLTTVAPQGLDKVFLCNSGSEAIDSALKLARLSSRRKKIVSANGSFHGFTFGALSATGIKKFRQPFEPMLPEVEFMSYGNLDDAERLIDQQTAAVILEPIQHEAGVNLPPADYFRGIREICDRNGTLLILDEVKTGFGKTGHLFACETLGITPDILILGKSLGGGMIPSGAILATNDHWKRFGLSFPMSASSYAGNTLTCRAGLAVLDIFEQTNILSSVKTKAEFLTETLVTLAKEFKNLVKGTTGQGLLHGLTMQNPKLCSALAKQLIQHNVLALPAFGNANELMIEPPLIITQDDLQRVGKSLKESLHTINRGDL